MLQETTYSGAKRWTSEQFAEFLYDRVVSRDRRDIERILFRCGLSRYDVMSIAEITRDIHDGALDWVLKTHRMVWELS